MRSGSRRRVGEDSNIGHAGDTRKLRDDLVSERKRNLELERQVEALKKINGKEQENKLKQLKKDYKQLLEAFERSEKIRRDQKELIHGLKKELNRLRRERDSDNEAEEKHPVKKTTKREVESDEDEENVPTKQVAKKKKPSTQ